jgi:hypothetical protein
MDKATFKGTFGYEVSFKVLETKSKQSRLVIEDDVGGYLSIRLTPYRRNVLRKMLEDKNET